MVTPGPMSTYRVKPARSMLLATFSLTSLNVPLCSTNGHPLPKRTSLVLPTPVPHLIVVSKSATTAEKLVTRARLVHKSKYHESRPRFFATCAEKRVIVFVTASRSVRRLGVLARSVMKRITLPKTVPIVRNKLAATVALRITWLESVQIARREHAATVVRKTISPRTAPNHASKSAVSVTPKIICREIVPRKTKLELVLLGTGRRLFAVSGKSKQSNPTLTRINSLPQ